MADINARRIFRHFLRTSFRAFVHRAFAELHSSDYLENWHVNVICDAVVATQTGGSRRLLICAPPRHLKSFIVSVCYPAWLLGNNPAAKILCISYAQELSEPFAHQCRKLMETGWFKETFPQCRLDPKRSSKSDLGTTRNGHRIASSVNGTMTGKGGDVIILDDLIKAGDVNSDTVRDKVNKWFLETLRSRLDNPKLGTIIVVAQRLHVDDLPGQIIERGGWRTLIMPLVAQEDEEWPIENAIYERPAGTLLHEKRFGWSEAEEMRRDLGSHLYEAQWNQRPALAGGGLIKREWLRYDEDPVEAWQCEHVVQSWDTASVAEEGNDYTVCATFGIRGKTYHLLDIYRDRIEFPQQLTKVREMRKRWNAHLVVFEHAGSGIQLCQQLQQDHGGGCPWIAYIKPRGSKAERAQKQTVKFERGQLRLPRKAPWRQGLESELMAFPKGKYDDQVDAIIQFMTSLDTGRLGEALVRAHRFG